MEAMREKMRTSNVDSYMQDGLGVKADDDNTNNQSAKSRKLESLSNLLKANKKDVDLNASPFYRRDLNSSRMSMKQPARTSDLNNSLNSNMSAQQRTSSDFDAKKAYSSVGSSGYGVTPTGLKTPTR